MAGARPADRGGTSVDDVRHHLLLGRAQVVLVLHRAQLRQPDLHHQSGDDDAHEQLLDGEAAAPAEPGHVGERERKEKMKAKHDEMKGQMKEMKGMKDEMKG